MFSVQALSNYCRNHFNYQSVWVAPKAEPEARTLLPVGLVGGADPMKLERGCSDGWKEETLKRTCTTRLLVYTVGSQSCHTEDLEELSPVAEDCASRKLLDRGLVSACSTGGRRQKCAQWQQRWVSARGVPPQPRLNPGLGQEVFSFPEHEK